jgi:hypothetical protein
MQSELTKVKIDRDREGWRYFTEDLSIKSSALASYPEIMKQAVADGYEIDNAGWKHRLLMWNWHNHSFDRYPGWEIEKDGCPAFVKLAHKRRGDEMNVESYEVSTAWDNVASVGFYQRDWTEDGIPFCREGDTYWSGWWFATISERDRFVKWYNDHYAK